MLVLVLVLRRVVAYSTPVGLRLNFPAAEEPVSLVSFVSSESCSGSLQGCLSKKSSTKIAEEISGKEVSTKEREEENTMTAPIAAKEKKKELRRHSKAHEVTVIEEGTPLKRAENMVLIMDTPKGR